MTTPIAIPTAHKKPYTKTGQAFLDSLTAWLQDTRLVSEAVFRLNSDYQHKGTITFVNESWPKGKSGYELKEFKIDPVPLGKRMHELLETTWSAQFVFLESLWEEYLQELVKELRLKDAKIFEPFCEKDFMANIVREALSDNLTSIDEIKDEAATRFAAGLTRQPWDEQWKQLQRLEIGLSPENQQLQWYKDLDVYFEVRNCIIHRKGKVSPLLNKKTDFYKKNGLTDISIWPPQLDYYRHQFIQCLFFIEEKIEAKFAAKSQKATS